VVKRQEALAKLLHCLKAANYHFTAVTPATHTRVLSRAAGGEDSLRDIFGWNRPFTRSDANAHVAALLEAAGALETIDGKLRSKVRVASLGDALFLHGAFPTDGEDAVFFGPDTYRFARFVERELPRLAGARWLVEMGAGSAAAAIRAATLQTFDKVTLVDRNAAALELASINAEVASVAVQTLLSDAIPVRSEFGHRQPALHDRSRTAVVPRRRRAVRRGSGPRLGRAGDCAAGTRRNDAALHRRCLCRRRSSAAEDARERVRGGGLQPRLGEIDPDVFGEELDQPHYRQVERIAAVGAVIKAPEAAAT
jgi:hypothetical protein